MAKDQSLYQDVADIRKIVESLEEKIDNILQIMDALLALQDAEYDYEDEDIESNEGWVGDAEWFEDEEDDN